MSVLDVGCGYDSPLRHVRKPLYKHGIDIFKKNITLSKKDKLHDAYTVGDVRKLYHYYAGKSFDAVICIDVIEHLTRNEGMQLLKHMEKIARKRVILLTPNGFYHQHDRDNNPYQVHKSGWSAGDFSKRGYMVFGLRGLQQLRDDHASIKYRPWIFWGAVTLITELLFFFSPRLSFDLFAVKKLD